MTEAEFREFVDLEVTRRFPDGLTVLKGDGQFRGEDNVLIKGAVVRAHPLVSVQKPQEEHPENRSHPRAYKDRFQQQSVLRVDDPFVVWVSF